MELLIDNLRSSLELPHLILLLQLPWPRWRGHQVCTLKLPLVHSLVMAFLHHLQLLDSAALQVVTLRLQLPFGLRIDEAWASLWLFPRQATFLGTEFLLNSFE